MEKIICKKCGNELTNGQDICSKCGTSTITESQSDSALEKQSDTDDNQPQKSHKKSILIVIAIAVLLLVVICLFVVKRNNNKGSGITIESLEEKLHTKVYFADEDFHFSVEPVNDEYSFSYVSDSFIYEETVSGQADRKKNVYSITFENNNVDHSIFSNPDKLEEAFYNTDIDTINELRFAHCEFEIYAILEMAGIIKDDTKASDAFSYFKRCFDGEKIKGNGWTISAQSNSNDTVSINATYDK